VRLFDLTKALPVRRAKLTLHGEGRVRPNDWMSDVAFTPDGRRVAAIAMATIVIWDATTGDAQDSLDRPIGGSSDDRLAISPDGRWLAATGPGSIGVSIYDISALVP
jgi:WD40 repeat protein